MTRPDDLRPIDFSEIEGWAQDQHAPALSAFQLSAQEIILHGHGFNRAALYGGGRQDWLEVAEKSIIAQNATQFFESEFQAFTVEDHTNLFTGYYEPQVQGSLTATEKFRVPIYARPPELHTNQKSYFTRKEIEQGALNGQELEICYLQNWEEAYFIHVQGNGRVLLPEGRALRLAFAAKNGHDYRSIGKALLERGLGTPETMSMQFLRAWMKANPSVARELMWENPSFIFFSANDVLDSHRGAKGAAKVPLTPLRSLAVDRSYWAFGTPIFLSTNRPPEAGAEIFRHLLIAQDTGSAIKGLARGDIYWGWGAEAELNAGHMKQRGKMIVLLPKPLAQRFLP